MDFEEIREYAKKNGYLISRSKDMINVKFKMKKKEDENILDFLTRMREKANKIGKKLEAINYEYFPHQRSFNFTEYPIVGANLKWKEREGVIMPI
jgi:hypothetical protein